MEQSLKAENVTLRSKVKQLELQIVQRTPSRSKKPRSNNGSAIKVTAQSQLDPLEDMKKSVDTTNESQSMLSQPQKDHHLMPMIHTHTQTLQPDAVQLVGQQEVQAKLQQVESDSRQLQAIIAKQSKELSGWIRKNQDLKSKLETKARRQTNTAIQTTHIQITDNDEGDTDISQLLQEMKEQLENQLLINRFTKQGLIISEEENYTFRLQIREMTEKIDAISRISNRSHRESSSFSCLNCMQVQKSMQDMSDAHQELRLEYQGCIKEKADLQQTIQHLEQLKTDYLNTCIKNGKQLQKLQNTLNTLQKDSQPSSQSSSCFPKQLSANWQRISSKIFQLSNCLPLDKNCPQSTMFQPKDQFQMISLLERIQHFATNIDNYEVERVHHIKNAKKAAMSAIKIVREQVREQAGTDRAETCVESLREKMGVNQQLDSVEEQFHRISLRDKENRQ